MYSGQEIPPAAMTTAKEQRFPAPLECVNGLLHEETRRVRDPGHGLNLIVTDCQATPTIIPQLIVTECGLSRQSNGSNESTLNELPLVRSLSNSSNSSTGFSSSFEESEEDVVSDSEPFRLEIPAYQQMSPDKKKRAETCKKIKTNIRWSPFHIKNWVQLAGHVGSFLPAETGWVLKRLSENEEICLRALQDDALKPFVPAFAGRVESGGEHYIQLQDLLANFLNPSVMDCKMGIRTFLEELENARERPRKDMYDKMVVVDPGAPTAEEHALMAVTKPRYMQWRETLSSSSNLGFRIEGIKRDDGSINTNFKKTNTKEQIVLLFKSFTNDNTHVQTKYLMRLRAMRDTLEISPFFQTHEVVGSSLLFVHDSREQAMVWMIDFGKTRALPAGQRLSHRKAWQEGNREDGYLTGLDHLIAILEDMPSSSTLQNSQ
uniref:inositol-trisphosphate 3-kinase B-like isoform X2 n=1 Tax=Myxine glutinosa TaxID=7769 RepID=UPI00358E833B